MQGKYTTDILKKANSLKIVRYVRKKCAIIVLSEVSDTALLLSPLICLVEKHSLRVLFYYKIAGTVPKTCRRNYAKNLFFIEWVLFIAFVRWCFGVYRQERQHKRICGGT